MLVGGRQLDVTPGYSSLHPALDNLEAGPASRDRPPTFASAWRPPEGTFPSPGGPTSRAFSRVRCRVCSCLSTEPSAVGDRVLRRRAGTCPPWRLVRPHAVGGVARDWRKRHEGAGVDPSPLTAPLCSGLGVHESGSLPDLGMRKLPHTAAEDLLELVMRRYERASTILTSNRPVDDWGKLLGDNAAVTALLDRLLHHGHILKCGPRSWRTKARADLHRQEATR